MEIIGYLAATIIGIILGLLGGGGSILSVPVLVYLFTINPTLATAYSLFIVGISSLIGVIPKYKEGLVNLKTAIIFGIPALVSVFTTRKFIIPNIPETIIKLSNFTITKANLTMLAFAVLMIAASFSMIQKEILANTSGSKKSTNHYLTLIFNGSIIGILTGFVGAGGGFLIIPTLVFKCNLPVKKAIGTSLLIIAVNSIIGFMGDLTINYSIINWIFLLKFTSLALVGIFIGNYLTRFVDSNKLKKGFGWFTLIMGVIVMVNELFF